MTAQPKTKRHVIVPIDLGGSLTPCSLRPPLRPTLNPDTIRAMIDRYRIDRGHVDEVAFFHGGTPSDQQLQAVGNLPIRLALNPADLTRQVADDLLSKKVINFELEFLSFQNRLIKALKRGYHPGIAEQVCHELKRRGAKVGLTLSPGLPGSTLQSCIDDVHTALRIGFEYVRICPTLALEGSKLAQQCRTGRIQLTEIPPMIEALREMIALFEDANIPVIRVGWQPKQDFGVNVIAGPSHPNLRALVEQSRFYDLMAGAISAISDKSATILVNPKDISCAKGELGDNIRRLRTTMSLRHLSVKASTSVARGQIKCISGVTHDA